MQQTDNKQMKDQVNQLFQEQLSEWDLAKNNYQALNQVRVNRWM